MALMMPRRRKERFGVADGRQGSLGHRRMIRGLAIGSERALRGGSWNNNDQNTRAAYRNK